MKYDSYGESGNESDVPMGIVDQAKVLVDKHAAQAHEMLEDIEKSIAGVGQRLDELKAAREILTGALRGTEQLRAEMRPAKPTTAPAHNLFV